MAFLIFFFCSTLSLLRMRFFMQKTVVVFFIWAKRSKYVVYTRLLLWLLLALLAGEGDKEWIKLLLVIFTRTIVQQISYTLFRIVMEFK